MAQWETAMIEREDIVAAVVAAAEGTLTGRVRLQKTVYLLDQLGLDSGFKFDYHHYGPYSRDLDNATADAKAFNLIDEKFAHRESDGALYSIFELKNGAPAKTRAYGELGAQRTEEFVRTFARTNVTVLELAATIDWLWRYEAHSEDWDREIAKRKPVKVKNGRLQKAVELLGKLGMPPPQPVGS
jgi:uncharacterized protein